MGARRSRLDKRREAATETRKVNERSKTKERARRDARMLERVKSGSLPYSPEVMSWLSLKLGKKSSRITAEDIGGITS
ncbi:MAG: hypothetical protein ACYSVY_23660 [Planctomycetota bacterium]|jgi:hypothetical protein